jgi:hypothetical protein
MVTYQAVRRLTFGALTLLSHGGYPGTGSGPPSTFFYGIDTARRGCRACPGKTQ